MKTLCLILFFSVFSAIFAQAEKKGDFLIISDPSKLSIFNQYEQPLAENELKNIPSYSPFFIVNRKVTLGDQITEAFRCKYQGATFFLLLDNKGGLKGGAYQAYQKNFPNCISIDDTVKLAQAVNTYQKYPSGGHITRCKADQTVIRIFQHSTSFYVFIPDQKRFGWVNGGSGMFKSIVKNTRESQTFSLSDISGMVEARLNAANDSYTRIFGYFNDITLQKRSIPQWKLLNDGKRLKCILSSSAQITGLLQKSTRYILQDIEQILLGKPFTVNYSSGEIAISPR